MRERLQDERRGFADHGRVDATGDRVHALPRLAFAESRAAEQYTSQAKRSRAASSRASTTRRHDALCDGSNRTLVPGTSGQKLGPLRPETDLKTGLAPWAQPSQAGNSLGTVTNFAQPIILAYGTCASAKIAAIRSLCGRRWLRGTLVSRESVGARERVLWHAAEAGG